MRPRHIKPSRVLRSVFTIPDQNQRSTVPPENPMEASAESNRELAWRRPCNVVVGSESVDDGGRVGTGMATQPNASLNALTRSSTTRPIMSPSASLQPFLLGNRFAWQGSSTNVSRLLPSRPLTCSSRL